MAATEFLHEQPTGAVHEMTSPSANEPMVHTSGEQTIDVSDDLLQKKRTKKKPHGFVYVAADSAEADTLKDKFWRDLEQGKIDLEQSEDMYTHVKRPDKRLMLNLRQRSSRRLSALSTDSGTACDTPITVGAGSSALPSTSDVHTPSSSGYDSSSIPSVGAVVDSPLDSAPSLSGTFAELSHPARKRPKGGKSRKLASSKASFASRPRSVTPKKNIKAENKFFMYVDATSEEADTLKDKFWRELEMGQLNVCTSTDLYSSVKVARRARQRAVATITGSGCRDDENDSSSFSTLDSGTTAISPTCTVSNGAMSSTASSVGGEILSLNCDHHLQERSDVEQMPVNPDSKLSSPCAVSVERLRFAVGNPEKETLRRSDLEHFAPQGQERDVDSDCSCSELSESGNASVGGVENGMSRNKSTRSERGTNNVQDDESSVTSENSVDSCKSTDTACSPASDSMAMKEPNCSTSADVKFNTELQPVVSELMYNESHSTVGMTSCNAVALYEPTVAHQSYMLQSWINDEKESFVVKGSLREAVECGDLYAVRHLLDHTSSAWADLNKVDHNGVTPLMVSTQCGYETIVDLLVLCGADIDAQCYESGFSALMIACESGHQQIALKLIKNGARLESRDRKGETALLKAIRSNSSDVCTHLLAKGANIGWLSYDGSSAAQLARDYHRNDIEELMEAHVLRLRQALRDEMLGALGSLVELGQAVFPFSTFPIRDCVPSIGLTFRGYLNDSGRSLRAVLFIGHALVGIHNVQCRLQGVSAVTAVSLNGFPLQPLSAGGNFVMSFQPISEKMNNLVLFVSPTSATAACTEALLVSAYFIQPKSR